MEAKKNILTYAGLKKLEEELHDLKVNKRKEIAGKIKEAYGVKIGKSTKMYCGKKSRPVV